MAERNHSNTGMRLRRFAYWFMGIFAVIIIWKLCDLQSGVDRLQELKQVLELNKDHLQLTEQQLLLLERLGNKNEDINLPTIYAVTPTYSRLVQKAELTRISQTLRLVPNVHWIIVEDADNRSDLVRNIIRECGVFTTHLNAKTPPFEKLADKDPRWKRHRGVEQRNTALKWIRDNLHSDKHKGIVYFMDDDNTYNIKVFDEMTKIKRVGVWPVGLVGGLNAESPIVSKITGKVTGYKSGWKPERPFAIDMSGFAINLELILTKPEANFSYKMEKGYQESEFLSYFTTKEELEPLADGCTKVYVWHTRTEKPVVKGTVAGLEV